ncbi:MAG: transcriptional regulator [Ruminococcaceae bacterium]|jgi:uncharacterized protein YaaQ|nr:transcriptional regulator [Oscillospiraceae bacterium]
MKLIIAVVNYDDSQAVLSELTRTGFLVTNLSTSGAFLKTKNVTLLIGTEDEKVSQAIEIISQFSSKRNQPVPKNATDFMSEGFMNAVSRNEITVGGATVFVMDVEQFYKL